MKIKLNISPDLALPPDAATSTIVVYGGKGMGKTNLASVLVEEFANAGIRFAVIDPMGVWWGLRHGADGKGHGIEVLILGGRHGDMPITPESGALVADLVVDEDASVIIDISRRADGSMWSISERIRFVRDYVRRIYQRQGEQRRPLHQVIDEAARFAPQIIRQGESDVAACMGAVAVLVEEGRNVGVGVTLVTQRSARLNKDVAELADCMIAFRIVGPNSMRAVLDWLGEYVEKARLKDISEKLRSLPRGSALVVSPGWLEFEGIVAMRMRETFDSSDTPKTGKQVRVSGAGAKPDLAKYRARLATIVEEQKANDPKSLKARIVELEKQAAAKPAPVAAGKTKTVEKSVIKDAQLTRIGVLIDQTDGATGRAATLADRAGEMMKKAAEMMAASGMKLEVEIGKLRETIASTKTPAPTPRAAPNGHHVYPSKHAARTTAPARKPADIDANGTPKIVAGLRRIMIALAQRPQGLTYRQIGVRAGISTKGGTFSTYMSRARGAGWISDHGDVRKITDAGIDALGHYDPLPQGSELAAYWLRELGGGAARILKVLIDHYPTPLDAARIGELSQVSSAGGTFSTYLSRLRGLELISGRGQAIVAAEEICP